MTNKNFKWKKQCHKIILIFPHAIPHSMGFSHTELFSISQIAKFIMALKLFFSLSEALFCCICSLLIIVLFRSEEISPPLTSHFWSPYLRATTSTPSHFLASLNFLQNGITVYWFVYFCLCYKVASSMRVDFTIFFNAYISSSRTVFQWL